MLQALLINTDGTASMIKITDDYSSLYDIVGGYIEPIAPVDGGYGNWHAYVNEEGKIHELESNPAATAFARSIGWAPYGGDFLVGPVVFLGPNAKDHSAEGDVPLEVVGAAATIWGLK